MKEYGEFLLGDSIFQSQFMVRKDMHETFCAIDYEKEALREHRHKMAEFLVGRLKTKKTEVEGGAWKFESKGLVFNQDEFKTVVDSIIAGLPMSRIMDIRNNLNIDGK